MKLTQVEEIKSKVNKLLDYYKSTKYPFWCYKEKEKYRQFLPTKLTGLLKTEIPSKIDMLNDEYQRGIKTVIVFYNSYCETNPTERECNEGIDFLKKELSSITNEILSNITKFFVESYGLEIPQREVTYTELESSNNNYQFGD